MAFLDNSGDIILDAVLTDLGRKKLSQGNFKVTKFALGDDEIDYGLYDRTNPTGSAYYGLTIQALPVQQALTNGAASLKSKLFTLVNEPEKLLYLPEVKLDDHNGAQRALSTGRNAYTVLSNEDTHTNLTVTLGQDVKPGFIYGISATEAMNSLQIRTPLGINNGNAGARDTDLNSVLDSRDGYSIVVDGRFLEVAINNPDGSATTATASPSTNVFSGNDNLIVYNITDADTGAFDRRIPNKNVFEGPSTNNVLNFSLVFSSTVDIDFLFSNYKTSSVTSYAGVTSFNVDVIATDVQVVALSTGVSLTIPVEIVRKQ
tara:strand:- start:1447 stop:2397 length:951 start_codon:yes stop_codon:yes gene_type:complete